MASISRDKNGTRRIQFVAKDGKRRAIRLGKITQRHAEAIKIKVEQLNAASITGHAIDEETARWLADLEGVLADKLAAVELIAPRNAAKLGSFLEGYLETRSDVKPLTKLKYETTRRYLLEFFGADRPLRSITAGCADEFRLMLVARKVGDEAVSENTIRKHIAVAKVFFTAAVRKKLIGENPFASLKATIQPNPDRFRFITRVEIQQVIEACPDAQWRLIVALSRFGGLRCPSEHLALKWGHIDWQRGRVTVPSPKTEHHAGKGSRTIPLFLELRQPLMEVFEQAEPGTEFVITRYRDSNANLRTQFERIIGRAGLEPWEKLFQNLRSSRETELAESFPLHVVTAWLGNSEPVARKHYLQVTDEHFARALKEAAHNAAQQASATTRKPSQPDTDNPVFAAGCDAMRYYTRKQIAEAGLEPARPFRNPGF